MSPAAQKSPATSAASSQKSWTESNNTYLSAALEWLRLRLQRLAALQAPPSPPVEECQPEPPAAPQSLLAWLLGPPSATPRKVLRPKSPPEPIDFDALIAGAAERLATAAQTMDPPPALTILADRFSLSPFERDLLLLCAAMELDSGMGALCGRAQGEATVRPPTFSLAFATFENPTWDVMSPERPLRFWRLIEPTQGPSQPLTAAALRADERIVNYIKGMNYLDDRITHLLASVQPAPAPLPPSQESIATAIVTSATAYASAPPVIHLMGADLPSKQWVASRVCHSLDLSLMKLRADLLPPGPSETENLARLWQRECTLLPLALYLDAQDADKELTVVNRFLGRTAGLVFLGTREAVPGLSQETLGFDIAKPTRLEQRDLWRGILGTAREAEAHALASQFNFSLADIERIARQAQGAAAAPTRERIWHLCLLTARPRLESLAQRIEVKADWDALVIAESERSLLMQLASQARSRMRVYDDWGFARRMNRGTGLTALFAGESGTGKTMAAEVIANELGLDLHRIDLSGVVSKYIGESEKNLRRVFDAAEDGGAILFFDEADALFGKRSEVKDSHDRYANIEVNYLLQRMEAFSGLAILATNMKSALDPAFVRRLRFIVNFAFPSAVDRKRMWERALPPETPREPLDYDRLSRLNLTGASIHNIALNATFLAATNGNSGRVGMRLLMDAARAEFRKLDKPVSDADFQWTQAQGAVA
ncbi:MAG: ATP-binding protein [Candidatus Solibacter sp.]